MTEATDKPDLATQIADELPYLRRYARALTGNQQTGDHYAAATLEALLADQEVFNTKLSPKAALFRVFHQIWVSSGSPVEEADQTGSPEARAQWRLSGLTQNTREALLLHSIEGFRAEEIASIIGGTADEASALLSIARSEMSNSIRGRIMIIEDEAIIAMDIRAIVEDMGHDVTSMARTRDEAVKLARRDPPDMILADIQLADRSSGIDAVNHILKELGDRPIVFITAFPERLLTGARPEPAFLITKPYTEEQVQSAVSQAMFFSSTETLRSQA
ncbi:response regulator receiver protein [Roseovarius azorensis]|uniref:Response regulator receiver protein n=1 Tax=Roseovarius azorensis TaxID=1287727 RepID=A0A1H7KLA2_9RHOB|nr:response regulator [Roseovarius azorensis]SEK87296.1 response regulator receiver protein [Roseovarius azorensis]